MRGFGDHLTKLWDHQTVIKSAKVIKTVRYSLINSRPSLQPIKVVWSSVIIEMIITGQVCNRLKLSDHQWSSKWSSVINDHLWSSLQSWSLISSLIRIVRSSLIITDHRNDHKDDWSSLQLAKLHLLNQFLDGQHVRMLRTIIFSLTTRSIILQWIDVWVMAFLDAFRFFIKLDSVPPYRRRT